MNEQAINNAIKCNTKSNCFYHVKLFIRTRCDFIGLSPLQTKENT